MGGVDFPKIINKYKIVDLGSLVLLALHLFGDGVEAIESQLPHKMVNLISQPVMVNNKLTILWGELTFQNALINVR